MWWKRFTFKNFQSLSDFTLELKEKSVHIISGLNHIGKSSIVRALRIFFYNDVTRGLSDYISWGKSSFTIEGERADGVIISTTRGAINNYKLKLPGEDEKVFWKLENTVPDEIKPYFNMYMEPNTGEALNVRNSDDPWLLINNKPAEIYSIIQSAIKTTEIAEAIKLGNEEMNMHMADAKKASILMESLTDKIEAIRIVDTRQIESGQEIIKQLVYEHDLVDTLLVCENKLQSITIDKFDIKEFTKSIDNILKSLHITSLLGILISNISSLDIVNRSIEALGKVTGLVIPELDAKYEIVDSLVSNYEKLAKINKVLSKTDRKALSKAEGFIIPKELEIVSSILKAMPQYSAKAKEVTRIREEVKAIKQQLADIYREAKVCPTCDRPFVEDKCKAC